MWRKVKLGDICTIVNGGTPKSNVKDYWDGNIKWLTPKDMGKLQDKYVRDTERQITAYGLANSSAKLVPKNSIILSCRAPIGHVFINDCEMSFNQGCKGLIPGKDLLVEYLYYFLFASKKLLNDLGTGTTFKEISGKTLSNVTISLPPLAEQQRIVAKLDAAFAEIDKLHRIKLTKFSNIQRLSAQRISQLVNALNTSCGKTSLSEVCVKITKGSSPKWQGINYVDEPGILFITSENVGNGELRMEKIKYVENKFNEKDSKSILQKGDVLTNIVGASIGRTAVFNLETSISANINQAVCLLRTDEKRLNPYFLSYLLNSDFFLNALHEGETSTARANISLSFLSKLDIPLPSLNEQILFLEECEAMTNACISASKNTEKQSNLAEELKSAILAQELQPSEAA